MGIYKLSEWQGSSGKWYCACVDNLGKNSGAWYMDARACMEPLAAHLKDLIEVYGAEVTPFPDYSGYSFCWESQAKMRKYKNMVNAAARKNGFKI